MINTLISLGLYIFALVILIRTNNAHDKFCPHCNIKMIGEPEVMSETIARFKKEVLEEMEAKK